MSNEIEKEVDDLLDLSIEVSQMPPESQKEHLRVTPPTDTKGQPMSLEIETTKTEIEVSEVQIEKGVDALTKIEQIEALVDEVCEKPKVSEESIKKDLTTFEQLAEQIEAKRKQMELVMFDFIPQDKRKELETLLKGHADEIKLIEDQKADVEAKIKLGVVELGKSISGTTYSATYTKPSVKYDAVKCDAYAVAHPEIKAFRTETKASVSMRKKTAK